MKFLNLSYFLLLLCALALTSCKNKLNINAPYKDIPTIYAVLSPQETIQIIRVNKTFLGEGNANQSAQIADSINYPAGELTLTLERFLNGSQVSAVRNTYKTVITFRDSIIQTNPGVFNTSQRVYYTYDSLFTSGQYVLKVKNNRTGQVFTARANSINHVTSNITPFVGPYYPVDPNAFPDPTNQNAYPDYSGANVNYSPKFYPSEGAIYSMKIRLHFFDSLNDASKIYRYVDYEFANQFNKDIRTIGNNKYFAFDFKGKAFFENIGNSLSKMNLDNNIKGRKMYKMEAFAYCSTQEYADFLQFSAPSLSIAQEKPLYSNFDDRAALGIFTFRSTLRVEKSMSTIFISAFSYNAATCHYKFFTSVQTLLGCS